VAVWQRADRDARPAEPGRSFTRLRPSGGALPTCAELVAFGIAGEISTVTATARLTKPNTSATCGSGKDSGGAGADWRPAGAGHVPTRADANKDGKLDLAEYRPGLLPTNYDQVDAETKHLFSQADLDKDGAYQNKRFWTITTSLPAVRLRTLAKRCAITKSFEKTTAAMPPKIDPTAINIVYLRAVGGEVGATASLAPKIGPLGLSPKKVGEDIAKATKEWKGLKVTVKLVIQNRGGQRGAHGFRLGHRALNEPPRDRKKVKHVKHTGNITFDEVVDIAKTMRPRSMAKTMAGTVKEILGTAQSVGCTVDGSNPHDIIDKVNDGSYAVPE
uniref:Large ribosomal subunit protein uL11 n=1 Tax=Macrostomum lignano TaxID=282301 RepID=A0A1I8JS00_9PLAT